MRIAGLVILLCLQVMAFGRQALALPSDIPASAAGEAGMWFERGVAYASARDLERARHAFEQAYFIQPHPDVLYNLGIVCADLGDLGAARAHLLRYLDSAAPGEQRTEAERTLGTIVLREAAHGGSRSAEGGSTTVAPPVHRAPSTAPPSVANAGTPQSRSQSTGTGPTLVLASAGVALLVGAAGVAVWNSDRYDDAKREKLDLDAHPPDTLLNEQQEVEAALVFTRRSERNAALFDSVRQFDVVAWTAAGLGAGLSLAAVYFHWSSNQLSLTATSDSIRLRGVW